MIVALQRCTVQIFYEMCYRCCCRCVAQNPLNKKARQPQKSSVDLSAAAAACLARSAGKVAMHGRGPRRPPLFSKLLQFKLDACEHTAGAHGACSCTTLAPAPPGTTEQLISESQWHKEPQRAAQQPPRLGGPSCSCRPAITASHHVEPGSEGRLQQPGDLGARRELLGAATLTAGSAAALACTAAWAPACTTSQHSRPASHAVGALPSADWNRNLTDRSRPLASAGQPLGQLGRRRRQGRELSLRQRRWRLLLPKVSLRGVAPCSLSGGKGAAAGGTGAGAGGRQHGGASQPECNSSVPQRRLPCLSQYVLRRLPSVLQPQWLHLPQAS